MAKINRELNKGKIIDYLNLNGLVSREKLALYLSVSKNTVSKYVAEINTGGLYYIETVHGPHGGYKLEKRNVDKKTKADIDEMECLMLAKEIIHKKYSKFFPEFEKFCLNISSHDSLSEKLYNNLSLSLESSKEDDNFEVNKKDKISRAIKESKKIELFETEDRVENGERKRLHPYGLVDFKEITYLIGYCEIKRNLHVVKLKNISKFEVLSEEFSKEINFTKEELVRFCAGVHKKKHFEIELHIKFPFDEIISSKLWSDNQKISRLDEDTIEFKGTLEGEEDIITWLLSMKDNVKIISPEYIKSKYHNTLRSMLNNIEKSYKKKGSI